MDNGKSNFPIQSSEATTDTQTSTQKYVLFMIKDIKRMNKSENTVVAKLEPQITQSLLINK